MFGWYFIWKSLSQENILNMEQIGNLQLQEWLDYMLISVKEKERDDLLKDSKVQFA